MKCVSADRDQAYFNILCTDGLVGTDHVLQEVELTRSTALITKLELEDILCRNQDQKEIFVAIQRLIAEDRPWSTIRFTDTIHVFAESSDQQSSSRAMFQLMDYEARQQELWDLMTQCNDCKEKLRAVSFEVKIMIDEGTSIEALLKLMRLLSKSSLERVEFGGALFGCSEAQVPINMANLFLKIKALDANEENSYWTLEMILINLFYAPPHLQSKLQPTVVTNCIQQMANRKMGKPIATRERSASPKREEAQERSAPPKQRRERSASPKRVDPEGGERSASPKKRRERSISPKRTASPRNSRKDRLQNKKASDPLGAATSHKSSCVRRRRRRQNSLPETDPDIRFVRQNTPDFRWDKMANYQVTIRAGVAA